MKVWKTVKNTLYYIIMSGLGLLGLALLVSYFFEDEVVNKLSQKLNQELNEPVNVSSIQFSMVQQFPNASLVLNDVFIADGKDTLIACEKVYLNFSPFDLISQNYHINAAVLKSGVVKIDNGKHPNYKIWQTTSQSDSKSTFSIESIKLKDLRFEYSDPKKLSGIVSNSSFHFTWDDNQKEIKGNAELSAWDGFEVALNEPVEAFVHYNHINSDLTGELKWSSTQVGANIHFGQQSTVFNLHNGQTTLLDLAHFQPESVQPAYAYFDSLSPIPFEGRYQLHKNGTDAFELQIKLNNTSVSTPLSQTNISGDLSIEKDKDNLAIAAENLVLTNPDGSPFANARFRIPDLSNQRAFVHLESGKQTLDLDQGKVLFDTLNLTFSSNWREEDIKVYCTQGMLEGVQFQWGNFAATSPAFNIHNNVVSTEELLVNHKQESMTVKGRVELSTTFSPLKANLSLNCRHFSPLLWSSSINALIPESEGDTKGKSTPFKGTFNADIEQIDVDGLLLEDLNCAGTWRNTNIRLSHFRFDLFNGSAEGKAAIVQRGNRYSFTSSGAVRKMDLPELFKGFKNFGQKALTHKHISGTGNADYSVSMNLNPDLTIDHKSVFSELSFTLQNGQLNNVPIMTDMGDFIENNIILRKSLNTEKMLPALEHVQLSPIENKITLKSGKLNIPKMHIESNVMAINISGSHTIDNDLDYHFNFRLQDILVRKRDSEFGYVVDDPEEGTQIFIKLSGTPEFPEFSYDKDAAKAYRKQKKEVEKKTIREVFKKEFSGSEKQEDVAPSNSGIRFEFDSTPDPEETEVKKKDRKGKISRFLKKITEAGSKEEEKKKESFEFEDDDL